MMYKIFESFFYNIDGKTDVKVENCHLVARLKLKVLQMKDKIHLII